MFKKISERIIPTTTKEATMLFVGEANPNWRKTLDKASHRLGQVKTVTLTELKHEALIYDLYILDDTHISNIPALIQKIQKRHSTARIIVASDEPLWEKSRDAFRIGAVDYIQKDYNYLALRKILHENLQKCIGAGCG